MLVYAVHYGGENTIVQVSRALTEQLSNSIQGCCNKIDDTSNHQHEVALLHLEAPNKL